jgi:glycosyltransferase involved in cell wall biosynthesis
MTNTRISGECGQVFHIARVWGSRHGGSIYARAMVEALIEKGWRVTLIAEQFLDPDDSRMNRLEQVRLAAFFRRGLRVLPRRLVEISRLWKRITNTPGALVIAQGDLPRITYVLLQFRVPLIFARQDGILTCPGNNRFLHRSRTVCGRPAGSQCLVIHRKEGCLGSFSLPKQLGRLAFRLRDRLLLRCIRGFVTVSRYGARVHGKAARVLYPPCSSGTAAPLGSERDLHRLIFCSRLEKVKGAQDAIRILGLLPESYRLEVLGDGPERGRLSGLAAELHLERRVRFHGWVDRGTRDLALASAGALLMPSLWDEAFGMAGIEALTQGTPVVAYDVGGISEWCRDGAGVLVPCGNVARAAAAVVEMTEDRRRWGVRSVAARRVVELQFPAGRFGRDLEEILEDVIGRDRRS